MPVHILSETRMNTIICFQTCNATGKYDLAIEYMLNSFKVTAEQTLTVVEAIKEMLVYYTSDDFLSILKGQKPVLEQMMNLIFKKVYVRISDLVDSGIHRQTASTYLKQLVDKGLRIA